MTPSTSPREYPLTGGLRTFMLLSGACFAALGLALLVSGAGSDKPFSADATVRVLGLLLAGFGACCIAYPIRFRIVLSEHAAEVRGLFKVQALRRDAIVGRRQVQGANGAAIELVPRDPAAKPMQLPLNVRVDAAFHAWLQPIPDQDAAALQRALEAMQANRAFGASPSERLAHVDRFGRRVRWLAYACLAAVLWGLLYPRPYEFVIGVLVVLPLLALGLAAVSKGAVGVDGHARGHHAVVGPLVFGPGIVLCLRTWLDLDTLDWLQGLGISLVVAVLLTIAIARIDRGLKPAGLWLIGLVFSLPYAYGALVQTNILLDASTSQRHEAAVLGKQETTGRGASRKLLLGAWGPVAKGVEVDVSRTLYAQAEIGGKVCVELFEGRWHLAWYHVRACPGDSAE